MMTQAQIAQPTYTVPPPHPIDWSTRFTPQELAFLRGEIPLPRLFGLHEPDRLLGHLTFKPAHDFVSRRYHVHEPIAPGTHLCRFIYGGPFVSDARKIPGYRIIMQVLTGPQAGFYAVHQMWLTDKAIAHARRTLGLLELPPGLLGFRVVFTGGSVEATFVPATTFYEGRVNLEYKLSHLKPCPKPTVFHRAYLDAHRHVLEQLAACRPVKPSEASLRE